MSENIQETCKTNFHFNVDNLQKAVLRYLDEESDTIKDLFDRALRRKRRKGKFDNCRIILKALLQSDDKDGITRGELLQIIRKSEPNYPGSNLNVYLKELTNDDRGSILRYDAAPGRYLFNNPFYRVFALFLFEQETNSFQKGNRKFQNTVDREQLLKDFEETLISLRKQITHESTQSLWWHIFGKNFHSGSSDSK
jgi:hypothetical protein